MSIHSIHQYRPDRFWQMNADGTFKTKSEFERIPRGLRSKPRQHRPMPAPLAARRPKLFDGSWRTPQSIARDADRAERKRVRMLVEAGRKMARDAKRKENTP